MVCHSVPAMPNAKRPRARLPGAPTRMPKVPLRFRALGGVDPRSLPPGTPYPCNDPAVGASVRGKQFAGKILGCATPPPGKRGRHFVVGGLESRSAIASAKRASERTRESLRARYEGPDFDARPKRRAPRAAAQVTGPRPSTVKRREEIPLPKPVFMRRTPEIAGPAWSPPPRAKARKAAPAESKAIKSLPTDDAARMDEAEALLKSTFGPVARQTFAPGFHPLPATRSAAEGALSLAEAVVTPSFKPKGESSEAKVFVARLHERPGVYAFWISKSNPDILRGVGGGDPPTQLVGANWKTYLKRAIAKK